MVVASAVYVKDSEVEVEAEVEAEAVRWPIMAVAGWPKRSARGRGDIVEARRATFGSVAFFGAAGDQKRAEIDIPQCVES